jgi:hypothetical protein
MTKSIVVTYDEADESFLLTLLNKIKVKTSVFEPKAAKANVSIANKPDEKEVNRLEILAAIKELDDKKFYEIAQEDLYNLITN